MLKLIIGVKGTGKTKSLIELVNGAAEKTNGTVVCIEKGTGLRFDVKYSVRLIDAEDYNISDAEALYGFVAGIFASNHDVTDLFIDSALKIAKNDMQGFEAMITKLDSLVSGLNVNVVITSSIPVDEASDTIKKYL